MRYEDRKALAAAKAAAANEEADILSAFRSSMLAIGADSLYYYSIEHDEADRWLVTAYERTETCEAEDVLAVFVCVDVEAARTAGGYLGASDAVHLCETVLYSTSIYTSLLLNKFTTRACRAAIGTACAALQHLNL